MERRRALICADLLMGWGEEGVMDAAEEGAEGVVGEGGGE